MSCDGGDDDEYEAAIVTPPVQAELYIPTLDDGGDDDEYEAAIEEHIKAAENAAILQAIGINGGGDDEVISGICMYIFYIYDILI